MMVDTLSKNKHEAVSCRLKTIQELKRELLRRTTFHDKFSWVMDQENVRKTLEKFPQIDSFVKKLGDEELFYVGLLILTDQFDSLAEGMRGGWEQGLVATLAMLKETDRFYDSIGGLLGYIEKTLLIFCGDNEPLQEKKFSSPPFYDMRRLSSQSWESIFEGIKRLPELGEIYVVGGAGDRLHLHDELTGLPVPVAYFPFCGRPLLEHLFRDLEAREFLHFRLFGRQLATPVLLMTSSEKENDRAIATILEQRHYFGRDPSKIERVVQPLVPLIASIGKLVFQNSMELAGKPGGHGVIWKLASDKGAFSWLKEHRAKALLVRQINNPLSGLDNTLSALVGFGLSKEKAFGFASCPRRHGFAEGLNVVLLDEVASEASISNIEYTRFARLTPEEAKALSEKEIPANANILFATIEGVEKALEQDPLPGLTVNAKNQCEVCENGHHLKLPAARLEATMQNIADAMMDKVSSFKPEIMREELSTFLQLYERSKLISVTKKAYQPGQDPHETPESCFYDWYVAGHRLLSEKCGYRLPDLQSLEMFLESGPSVLFFFHPALGPFWDVIAQKVRGGILLPCSELELEIAEIYVENLSLDGSFRIISDSPTGRKDSRGVRHYSNDVGRALLRNISIKNGGIRSSTISDHVRRRVSRAESCTICLEGASEVVAEDLSIVGDFHLVVPHGKRALLSQDPSGKVRVEMQDCNKAGWNYLLHWEKGDIPILQTRV